MSPALTKAERKPESAWDDTRLVKECLAGNHEAADVFQWTCMELLTRLPELRKPQALPKWLMQVAHHQCFRVKRHQQRLVSRDAEPDLPDPETPAIAETLMQQTQEEQMLREAMGSLSPQCRRLVELLFFEPPPRPYADVAAELGLALGSIGFTRQKCIERLRRSLDELGFH